MDVKDICNQPVPDAFISYPAHYQRDLSVTPGRGAPDVETIRCWCRAGDAPPHRGRQSFEAFGG